VAELSPQKPVCGSASGKSKKECSSFRSPTILSYQCQHENTEVERRDMTRLKYMKKTETSTEQSSLYKCLFEAPSVRNQRGDKGVLDSSGSPLVETTRDFTHQQRQCCMFLCAAKIT
jgi:hypothetical protein